MEKYEIFALNHPAQQGMISCPSVIINKMSAADIGVPKVVRLIIRKGTNF